MLSPAVVIFNMYDGDLGYYSNEAVNMNLKIQECVMVCLVYVRLFINPAIFLSARLIPPWTALVHVWGDRHFV